MFVVFVIFCLCLSLPGNGLGQPLKIAHYRHMSVKMPVKDMTLNSVSAYNVFVTLIIQIIHCPRHCIGISQSLAIFYIHSCISINYSYFDFVSVGYCSLPLVVVLANHPSKSATDPPFFPLLPPELIV